MSNSNGVSVIVVNGTEDHNESINTALRDSGHAAHCHLLPNAAEFATALPQLEPQLVLLIAGSDCPELERVGQHCQNSAVQVPLLLVSESVDEATIATAMQAGARDVVSLSNTGRFQAVADRELRSFRVEQALAKVMNSANQFKHELNSLKEVSVEAIADVQEGIVVNVNPAWVELFGYEEADALIGQPVMDLCCGTDQPALKGGIVACQRGKWQDEKLDVSGVRPDGAEFKVAFCLENVEHDGEPAVRMLVKPDTSAPPAPEVVVDRVVQRDPDTGLYNRQYFLDSATTRLDTQPDGGTRALAYIRIDRFSRAASDVGLLGTASIMRQFAQLVRDYAQPNDIYGRFGDSMFLILLERGNMADAMAWCEQFGSTVEAAVFEHEKRSTVMTCSIGLVEADAAEKPFGNMLHEAEQACRAAREQGGNRTSLSETSGSARQMRQDDSIWVPRIRGALMDNRFRLEHQPIGGLNSEIGEAYDILVRMLDDEGNTILPSEFMPAAERTGMTKNIDRWVIGATLSFCMTNTAELIFVRLSRDSILDDTLAGWLQSQLERTHISPVRLCFEVDELHALEHLLQTQQLSEALRDMGFRFAIEHVGRSTDSAQVLQRIGIHIAKIDGSLMQGLHKNAELQAQVTSLVEAARANGAETVAERVQDANTMAVLWQLGISFIQGNYVQKSEIVIEDTTRSTVTTRALQLQS